MAPYHPAMRPPARHGDRPEKDTPFVQALVQAYASGAFPMADPATGEIAFFTADPRAIVPLDDRFHVPRSVERDIRRNRFTLRSDTAFEDVVAGCAAPRRGAAPEDAWLDDRLASWLGALHRAGYARSLEAWIEPDDGPPALVGGIYGVSIGAAFFGESMFHRPKPRRPDGARHPLDGSGASSVCLVELQRHLARCGYRVFDAQVPNPHTERFGLVSIPLEEYTKDLSRATQEPDRWRPYEPAPGAPS